MKKLLTAIAVLSFTVAIAQGTSSNLRRVSREVEKTMSITSDIIDGVMTYEKEKKITLLWIKQFNSVFTMKICVRQYSKPGGPVKGSIIDGITT